MNNDVLKACQAFSAGDAPASLDWMVEDVRWINVEADTYEGLAKMRELCAEMADQAQPVIVLKRTLISEGDEGLHVIIEGDAKPKDETDITATPFQFCDIFKIKSDRIVEVTSYVVVP